MGINLDRIKNTEDLKKVLKFLDDEGFGSSTREWELHQKKVNDIIFKSNTLNIKYDNNLNSTLYKLTDYDEIESQAKQFFSKFNPSDKIFELLNTFYLDEDDKCSTPSSRPDNKDIINWVRFKKLYGLTDEYGVMKRIEYYNLDKNMLKIRFSDEAYEFKKLYKLIFDEECLDFKSSKYGENKYGEWQNLGQIEIKIFANGYANIKGNLIELKEYYYKQIIKKLYLHTIIKYKGKVEILKGKEN